MKYKIVLDTVSDVTNFVKNVSIARDATVTVTDGNGLRVNAKSIIGMLYALEFDELWCESDTEIYEKIRQWVR